MSPVPSKRKKLALLPVLLGSAMWLLTGCADAIGPKAKDVNIPAPKMAEERRSGVNENSDAVTYLPLGDDVLVPQADDGGTSLPSTIVGPFELRSETLAGALQLVLDGVDVPIAFETESGLTKTVTMTNLKGPLDSVVQEICSLGNMYCSYQNGVLVVKDTQIFTVTIPPIVSSDNMGQLLTNISSALGEITGSTPITDASTRTIVYKASARTAEMAKRYFQRLRSNTALIVFETYIWEVGLDSGNSSGIKWSSFDKIGRFRFGINLPGAAATTLGTPVSIGLPTTGSVNFTTGDVLQFISDYGAVKTISQPQITVLSGSSATLRVADTQNYVASISRTTTDGGNTTVSTTTDSVDSGFTLQIGSNWDNSTVYGTINILLQEVRGIDTFDENPDAVVQLPQTTERELQTQIRIRPGDSLLIAGLVRESDNYDKTGPGMNEPILPFTRTVETNNTELVFLMRPRVVVFTSPNGAQPAGAVPSSMTAVPGFPSVLSGITDSGDAALRQVVDTTQYVPVSQAEPVAQPAGQAIVSEPLPVVSSDANNVDLQPMVSEAVSEAVSEQVSESEAAPPAVVPPTVTATPTAPPATSDPSVIVNYDVLGPQEGAQ
jgi:hypothetical protein